MNRRPAPWGRLRGPKFVASAESVFGRARRSWLAAAVAVAVASSSASAAGSDLSDLAYGSDRQQVLDLHLPARTDHPAPVLVFFHGGAFVGGDKHPCAPRLAALLTARGIAFACSNYRLAPRVHYPVPMLDGARAVQWLRAHAGDYNLDAKHVAVMGMSAGAGIALWIAFRPDLADPGSPDPVLRQSTSVSAVVTGNAQATYDPAEIEAKLHTRHIPQFLAELFGAASVASLGEARFAQAEHDASPTGNMHAGRASAPGLLCGRADHRCRPTASPRSISTIPNKVRSCKRQRDGRVPT